MASVAQSQTYTGNLSSGIASVTLPAGIVTGNRLIVCFGCVTGSSFASSLPTGWTSIQAASLYHPTHIIEKVAEATDAGSTLSWEVFNPVADGFAVAFVEIENAGDMEVAGSSYGALTSTMDFGAITPTWGGSADTLLLAVGTTGDDTHAVTIPGSYDGNVQALGGTGGTNNTVTASIAWVSGDASATLDPASWTITQVERIGIVTLAIESSGGGSTTVEASVGFGLQLSDQISSDASAEGSLSEGLTLNGTFTTGLIVDAVITSALALDGGASSDASAEGGVSSAIAVDGAVGAVAQAESDVVGALALNSGFTGDVSAAGEIEGVVTFGLDLTGQATAEAQALAAIVTSMELDSSATAEVSHEASVGFDLTLNTTAQAEATAEAALLMTTELATAVVAEALTEANVQFATIHDVTFTGATVSASFTTPAGRTFKVLAETRVFKVSADQ